MLLLCSYLKKREILKMAKNLKVSPGIKMFFDYSESSPYANLKYLIKLLLKLSASSTLLNCRLEPVLEGVFDVGIWAHNLLSDLLSDLLSNLLSNLLSGLLSFIFIRLGWTGVAFLKRSYIQGE